MHKTISVCVRAYVCVCTIESERESMCVRVSRASVRLFVGELVHT